MVPARPTPARLNSNGEHITMATKVDYNAVLTAAAEQFGKDGDVEAFQSVYRSIPAPSRGAAQSAAMTAHIGNIEAILSAITNLPATATSRTVERLTDEQEAAIRQYIGQAIEAIEAPFTDSTDEVTYTPLMLTAFEAAMVRLAKVADNLPIGNGKVSYNVEVTTLLDAGATLTGKGPEGEVTATLNADGTVTMGDVTGSLSEMAGNVLGRNQNGWRFWRFEGDTLHTLRANLLNA